MIQKSTLADSQHKGRLLKAAVCKSSKQTHLGRSVKAADKVGRHIVFTRHHCTAKVTQLDLVVALVDEDVVGLDIRMQHPVVCMVRVVFAICCQA